MIVGAITVVRPTAQSVAPDVALQAGPAGPPGKDGAPGAEGPPGPPGGVTALAGRVGALTLVDIKAAAVSYQGVQDANYLCMSADVYISMASLTAARTITLPSAAAYRPGQTLYVADESGACSPTLAITVAAAGTDTIAGQAFVSMGSPYQKLAFHSNGLNLWTVA